MPTATDDILMTSVKDGATHHLAELFERHHRALYRFFYHLSGARTLAEDLTQEVFFRMLKFRSTFQPGARFTPWMYQIARNVHNDHLRRRANEIPFAPPGEMHEWEPVDLSPSPELDLLHGSDLAVLRKALQRLPADRRELLVLCRYQNLKYDEIGLILNCDAATVKARVFRTMRQLTDIFYRLSGRKAS